jgi:hypothetical protein
VTTIYPQQIIYLRHDNCFLYAEVVQVAQIRQICWVRPLALVVYKKSNFTYSFGTATITQLDPSPQIYDLRQAADLLLPVGLVQMALDTEAIPLLARLTPLEEESRNSQKGEYLQWFIYQLWRAHPEMFHT